MSFTTYSKARKYLVRAGVAAAPFVVALHAWPIHHDPLLPPPEHVEMPDHAPTVAVGALAIEYMSSGGGGRGAQLAGTARITVTASGALTDAPLRLV